MASKQTIGKRIKRRRTDLLLRLTDVARRTGLHPDHLSRLESGYYMPSPLTKVKLAFALQTTRKELFGDED